MRPQLPEAPATLHAPAAKLWDRILNEYAIDDEAGLLLLQVAMEAYQRMVEAQEILQREGLVVAGTGGCTRAHPAVQIERDSRRALLDSLKALNLSVEPLRPGPGRPPGGGN